MSDYYQYRNTRPGYNIGVVEILVIINVIMFIPVLILLYVTRNDLLLKYVEVMSLNVNIHKYFSIDNGAYWQILTAMFMHGGISHIFFNMYGLYLFGKPLEMRMGSRKFLFFYLATGVLANIASVIFFKFATAQPVSLIGASGAIFGVLLGFGAFYPEVRLLLFFIIPIRVKWAVLLYGGIELFSEISSRTDGIAHITHLFGFVFAYLYLLIFFRINAIKEMFFTKRNYY